MTREKIQELADKHSVAGNIYAFAREVEEAKRQEVVGEIDKLRLAGDAKVYLRDLRDLPSLAPPEEPTPDWCLQAALVIAANTNNGNHGEHLKSCPVCAMNAKRIHAAYKEAR